MDQKKVAHPVIASQREWLARRLELLGHEKELTQLRDRVVAARRFLPMVRIEKSYEFEGVGGKCGLLEMFESRQQLIIYHFMFGPSWESGCPACTGYINSLGDVSVLNERDTTLAIVSRAEHPKLVKYGRDQGWSLPWYSSYGSDFNYDFHVTLDHKVAKVEYNYKAKEELLASRGVQDIEGEEPGISVFFRLDDDVFHTYSTYARGTEDVSDAYHLLDMTPYGRQEDWEDSPIGWPQRPTQRV